MGLFKSIDKGVLEYFGPRGVVMSVRWLFGYIRTLQTGYIL